MRTLETVIRWTGEGCKDRPVMLTLEKRIGNVAIYRREHQKAGALKSGGGESFDGTVIEGYEVIRIRTRKPRIMFGCEVPAREVYPSGQDFGRYGKFCLDRDRAESIMLGWCRLSRHP